MILLCASAPSQSALSAEWHKITGDSMIVDCRPITSGESGDYSEGFMEVFKYAVKFSDLSLEDNWHASQVLKGKRLLNSFGLFRGVEVPESLLDEPLDSLPYWDRFYRFIGGEYRFTGESPRTEKPHVKTSNTPAFRARLKSSIEAAQGSHSPRAYEVCKPADPAAVAAMPGRRKASASPLPKPPPKSDFIKAWEAEQSAKRSKSSRKAKALLIREAAEASKLAQDKRDEEAGVLEAAKALEAARLAKENPHG